jgi:hypothetical protein
LFHALSITASNGLLAVDLVQDRVILPGFVPVVTGTPAS